MAATMDKVLPLHYFDDNLVVRSMILTFQFVFDGQLCPHKLHESLASLAKNDGWQKLGARLRRNRAGRLEYHIPASFDGGREAVTLRHTIHNGPKSMHPAASKLPSPTSAPSVLVGRDEFKSLAFHPDTPRKLRDYLNTDIPQLFLHVVSFDDATLVCLTFPHTLCDMMGLSSILHGWAATLSGNSQAVPRLYGAEKDPFAEFGTRPKEPFGLAEKQLPLLRVLGRQLWNLVKDRLAGTKTRNVCIPSAFLSQVRGDMLGELSKTSSADPKPFLSDGDVLCAWWSRTVMSQLAPSLDSTLVIYNSKSYRSVVTDIIPPGFDYVSNASGLVPTLVPMKTVLTSNLGLTASSIRQGIVALGTRSQAEAFAGLVRQSSIGFVPQFGEQPYEGISFSNFTKSNLFQIDFSAAILGDAKAESKPAIKPGTPYSIQLWEGIHVAKVFWILGKDGGGNYWISGALRNETWSKIAKILGDESFQDVEPSRLTRNSLLLGGTISLLATLALYSPLSRFLRS